MSKNSLEDARVKSMKYIIHDGDHGGDDFIATLAILSRRDKFHLLGITTCGGNIDAKTAARNALIACQIAGCQDVPVHIGSNKSLFGSTFPGDGAHGADGIGGASFPEPTSQPSHIPAVDWLIETIKSSDKKITIFATGPLTNIASALKKAPDIKTGIQRIIIMGGAFGNPGGNITKEAEFNFAMDPLAADYVLKMDGLNRVLIPLDATHSLRFGPRLQETIIRMNLSHGTSLVAMMKEAEKYDMPRFGSDGAFIHDPHVIFYDLSSEVYLSSNVPVRVEIDGEKSGKAFIADSGTQSTVAMKGFDIGEIERMFLESFNVLNQ